ncbi:MAG: choice-of-anchor B family protein [Planctomycetes bacterium]|nr:choice-of-anchor B family protein [Planctomycetota bacterium]
MRTSFPSPSPALLLLSASILAALGLEARAHDGDGKTRDLRPRFEVARGTRGGSTENLPLAAEDFAFPANGVELMSWIPLRDFGYAVQNANACFGYAAPSGREYAIVGLYTGTAFVEVTDPGDPTIVSVVPGPSSLWRDMKVRGTTCYAVSEGGGGIQVIDLSQIDAGVVTLANSVTTGGSLATHTVAVDTASGFLYRCGGGSNGLRIYDLANPLNPVYVASWGSRYVHECQAVTYTSGPWAGRQIVFACGGLNGGFDDTSLDILDVTNKTNIQLLSRTRYSNRAYSHQGWLSEDRQWFYLNDELDETGSNLLRTRVFNVSSLTSPVEHPSFSYGTTAIDHNLYVHQGKIFQANYRSGLQVFDATTPAAPTRVAWFDTWPQDEGAYFNSLWDNYPFLPSGTVIGSDIEKGLFVWRLGPSEIDFAFPAGPPEVVSPAGQAIAVEILAAPGVLQAGSAKLHVDLGTGWSEIPLAPQPGGTWLASFPPAACGADLSWYLSARTNTGRTWTAPRGAPTLVAHATAAQAQTMHLVDRLESPGAWSASAPGDDATDGLWVHGDPNGSRAQPEDDHTFAGVNCWFTGQAPPQVQVGYADVDGGRTTLRSPVYDLSLLADPVISYWRWYSNAIGGGTPHEDVFQVDVSNDGGATWTPVETVGPTGPDVTGGWRQHQFRVADFVPPTSQVRLRFVASDLGNPSTIEAAIDDLAIADVVCAPTGPATYCTAKLNSQGCAPAIGASGTPSASSPAAFTVTCVNVLNNKPGILIWGLQRAATPFQGGTLCVAAPVRRTPLQVSGGNPPPGDCSGAFAFDFNALLQAGQEPALVPGARVVAQYWSRDPLDPLGFGSSLSDALEFTIQP